MPGNAAAAPKAAPKAPCFCYICVLFCSLISVLVLLLTFTTTVRTPPQTFLESIYIPSLDKDANSSTDTTLTFNVNFKNQNRGTRLNYDNVNVTFYDGTQRGDAIANYTASHFHQDRHSVLKGGRINTNGFNREAAMRDISANGYWILRVDLATSIRYKFLWKSPTKRYRRGANVHIGDTGIKVHHNKGAQLTSGATKICRSIFERMGFISVNLFVACFLCSYY